MKLPLPTSLRWKLFSAWGGLNYYECNTQQRFIMNSYKLIFALIIPCYQFYMSPRGSDLILSRLYTICEIQEYIHTSQLPHYICIGVIIDRRMFICFFVLHIWTFWYQYCTTSSCLKVNSSILACFIPEYISTTWIPIDICILWNCRNHIAHIDFCIIEVLKYVANSMIFFYFVLCLQVTLHVLSILGCL